MNNRKRILLASALLGLIGIGSFTESTLSVFAHPKFCNAVDSDEEDEEVEESNTESKPCPCSIIDLDEEDEGNKKLAFGNQHKKSKKKVSEKIDMKSELKKMINKKHSRETAGLFLIEIYPPSNTSFFKYAVSNAVLHAYGMKIRKICEDKSINLPEEFYESLESLAENDFPDKNPGILASKLLEFILIESGIKNVNLNRFFPRIYLEYTFIDKTNKKHIAEFYTSSIDELSLIMKQYKINNSEIINFAFTLLDSLTINYSPLMTNQNESIETIKNKHIAGLRRMGINERESCIFIGPAKKFKSDEEGQLENLVKKFDNYHL